MLPTENAEEIEGIAVLADKIAREYYAIPKDRRNGRVSITASTSFFVPKPFTPFQWARMDTAEEYLEKKDLLRQKLKEQLNYKSIRYNWHDANLSVLEGVFARGDRRLSQVICSAYRKGCLYDSWSEYFRFDLWMEAFEENDAEIGFYIHRERDLGERLPWDFIDAGVTKEFFIREYNRAKEEKVTPNCRRACSGCGARVYGGGVCFEERKGDEGYDA